MVVSIAAEAVQGVHPRLPGIRVVPEIVVLLGFLLVLPAAGLEIELREEAFVQVVGGEPVVVAGHIEQLVGEVRRIVPAADRNLRQGAVRGGEHVDGLVGAGQVELVLVVEGDGRNALEGMGEDRLEGDVAVDHPLRVQGPGRNAVQLVVAQFPGMPGALPGAERLPVQGQIDVPDIDRSHVAEGVARQLAQAEADPEGLRALRPGVADRELGAVVVQVDGSVLRVQADPDREPLLHRNLRRDEMDLVAGHEDELPRVLQVRRVHQVHVVPLVGDDAEDAAEHVVRPVEQVEGHLQRLPLDGNRLPVLQGEAGELVSMGRIGDDMEAIVQSGRRDAHAVRHGLRRRREIRRAGQKQRADYVEQTFHPGFSQVLPTDKDTTING